MKRPQNVNDPKMAHMERVARMAIGTIEERARLISHELGNRYGVDKLSPDQEERYWMQADASVNPDRLRMEGVSEEEIGAKYFPLRQRMMTSGGRIRLAEQVEYVERMNQRVTQHAGTIAQKMAFPEPYEPIVSQSNA